MEGPGSVCTLYAFKTLQCIDSYYFSTSYNYPPGWFQAIFNSVDRLRGNYGAKANEAMGPN